jgi:hypothetical protein
MLEKRQTGGKGGWSEQGRESQCSVVLLFCPVSGELLQEQGPVRSFRGKISQCGTAGSVTGAVLTTSEIVSSTVSVRVTPGFAWRPANTIHALSAMRQ